MIGQTNGQKNRDYNFIYIAKQRLELYNEISHD